MKRLLKGSQDVVLLVTWNIMAGGLAAILDYGVTFGMEVKVGKLKEPGSVTK